jgi:hypothetical protein
VAISGALWVAAGAFPAQLVDLLGVVSHDLPGKGLANVGPAALRAVKCVGNLPAAIQVACQVSTFLRTHSGLARG